MNIDNVRATARFIQQETGDGRYPKNKGISFDMSAYLEQYTDVFRGNACMTAACVAGSAVLLKAENDPKLLNRINDGMNLSLNVRKEAEEFLDLNEEQATALFAPEAFKVKEGAKKRTVWIDNLRRKHAIFVLRKCADRLEKGLFVNGAFIKRSWIDSWKELGEFYGND